jgi:hypothetical protein
MPILFLHESYRAIGGYKKIQKSFSHKKTRRISPTGFTFLKKSKYYSTTILAEALWPFNSNSNW